MSEIDKLAWLCIKDNQLLLARSKGNDTYYLPGGKREYGESDVEALIREIKEELSVRLVPSTINYIKTFTQQAHAKPEGVLVKMACYTADFTEQLKASAEIEEIIWVNEKNKVKCSLITEIIIEWLQIEGLLSAS